MGMSEIERKLLKGGTASEPYALRLKDAITYSGLSRSSIYRKAAEGRLVLMKDGKSTLVLGEPLRALIDELPRAVINVHLAA